jgi:hypothetical protein
MAACRRLWIGVIAAVMVKVRGRDRGFVKGIVHGFYGRNGEEMVVWVLKGDGRFGYGFAREGIGLVELVMGSVVKLLCRL